MYTIYTLTIFPQTLTHTRPVVSHIYNICILYILIINTVFLTKSVWCVTIS